MAENEETRGVIWRKLAAQTRAAASFISHPETKATMLDMAERYERLAKLAEERSDRKKPE